MARKVARPDNRQKFRFEPKAKFLPNPPKICPTYGTDHNMVRKFKTQTVDNPEYKGPPPPPIVVLSCECGHEEPVDLFTKK